MQLVLQKVEREVRTRRFVMDDKTRITHLALRRRVSAHSAA